MKALKTTRLGTSKSVRPASDLIIDVSSSSSIEKMVYIPSIKALAVQWKKSATAYQYAPVTKAQVTDLVNAESKGKWLVDNITTNPKYNPMACVS